MSVVQPPHASDHRFRDALLVVAIFTLLGPLIGGAFVVFALSGPQGFLEVIVHPNLARVVATYSYWIGGLPAFFTGLLAALGRLGGREIPGVALAVFGAGASLPLSFLFLETAPHIVAAVVAAGLLSALVCYYLGRGILRGTGTTPIGPRR